MKLEEFLNELSRNNSINLQESSRAEKKFKSDKIILAADEENMIVYNPQREKEVRQLIKNDYGDEQGNYFEGSGEYRGEGRGPWVVDRDWAQFEMFPTWQKAFAAYARGSADNVDSSLEDKEVVSYLKSVPEKTILKVNKAYKKAIDLYKALR